MVTPDAINAMLKHHWPLARVRCTEVDAVQAVACTTPELVDVRPGGFISGPTQFAMADSAFWFLISGALGRVETMAMTSELSIRFLRPAQGDTLFARASLDKMGKYNVVATIRVWTTDEMRPCAVAQGTYVLPRETS